MSDFELRSEALRVEIERMDQHITLMRGFMWCVLAYALAVPVAVLWMLA
ncbi:hypothetical protein FIU97_14745 [Roseivivax sp. THAF40]|nr:hypothetical protein [Roseivivax sp. THAF40]QFT47838.1 hypothetical protein FIU97_14745 [Roseivivax sp. THAF40]